MRSEAHLKSPKDIALVREEQNVIVLGKDTLLCWPHKARRIEVQWPGGLFGAIKVAAVGLIGKEQVIVGAQRPTAFERKSVELIVAFMAQADPA